MPLISVIIPTYNRCGKVHRAIDSVLRQSFKDFELIVVDDASTDRTAFWCEKYSEVRFKYSSLTPLPGGERVPGGRERVLSRGPAAARNFGAKLAQGEWLCFLDSDDVWYRHKLSEQVRFHADNLQILISQTDDVWIRNSMRVNKMQKHAVREGSIFKDSLERCLICCSSVMVNKKLFFDVGGFDETLETCEDYDLWLRILAKHQVGFVKKALVTKFGGHEDQLSKKFPVMDKYRIYALEKLLAAGNLNHEQANLVSNAIKIKSEIVNKGRVKRENQEK